MVAERKKNAEVATSILQVIVLAKSEQLHIDLHSVYEVLYLFNRIYWESNKAIPLQSRKNSIDTVRGVCIVL